MEQNIMNSEEVAMEATEEIVTTKSGGGLVKKIIIGGLIALAVFGVRKGIKAIKDKRAKAKAAVEEVEATDEETLPKPIFDENGEPIDYEEN